MKIQAMYMPSVVPKHYKTTETHVKIVRHWVKDEEGEFVLDETTGKKIKAGPNTLEIYEKESTGGILFKFPRGHSIRLTSPDQIKQFRLTDTPKLVDMDSGEEVNEQGVPVSLAGVISGANNPNGGDFGSVEVPETSGVE